jgi:hypothetical protein
LKLWRIFFLICPLFHFLPNEVQAQSPSIILDKAILLAEEHGQAIGSFKIRVKVQE